MNDSSSMRLASAYELASARKPQTAHTLKIASYNIHGGIGSDRHFVPNRIVEVLREIDADIIALQEVESRTTGFDMLNFLGDALSLKAIPGPTLLSANGDYGNGILTRLPILTTRRIDLSFPDREARGAIDIELRNVIEPLNNMERRSDIDRRRIIESNADSRLRDNIELKPKVDLKIDRKLNISETAAPALRVIATHLGLHPAERRAQVQQLLAILESDRKLPTIFLGDVNEWFLMGRPLRWLHRHFLQTPSPATFPAKFPIFALDRIWVKPRAMLVDIYAHRSKLSRKASDHLPIVAIINVE